MRNESARMLQTKIGILTEVRSRIASNKANYICKGIRDVVLEPRTTPQPRGLHTAARRLTAYIARQLAPYPALTAWMSAPERGGKFLDVHPREARLLWIDWMLNSLRDDLAHKIGVER